MSKQFVVGKQYKLVDLTKGDGDLKYAIARGIAAFPADGVFTCHSLIQHKGSTIAGSHTPGVVNTTWDEEGDIPAAFEKDLEAGVFEEVSI